MSETPSPNSQALSNEVVQKERTVVDILWFQDEPCYDEADKLLKEALAQAGSHWYRAVLLKRLSKLRRLQGKYDEASTCLVEAAEIAEQNLGLLHPVTCRLREKLVRLLDKKWRAGPFYSQKEARAHVEKFYLPLIARVGQSRPEFAAVLNCELAHYYHEDKDFHEDARRLYHQVLGDLEDAGTQIGNQWPACAAKGLGHIYFQQDDLRRAHEFYSIALRWYGPSADVSKWLIARIDKCAAELEGEALP